jgi:hypothetical protein
LSEDKKRQEYAAGFTGASVATGVIALANMLPVEYATLKTLLIYTSPALTIVVRFIYIISASWASKTILDRTVKKVRMCRDRTFADPNSSDKHREFIQNNLEKLEGLQVEMISADAERVRAVFKEIPR